MALLILILKSVDLKGARLTFYFRFYHCIYIRQISGFLETLHKGDPFMKAVDDTSEEKVLTSFL